MELLHALPTGTPPRHSLSQKTVRTPKHRTDFSSVFSMDFLGGFFQAFFPLGIPKPFTFEIPSGKIPGKKTCALKYNATIPDGIDANEKSQNMRDLEGQSSFS